MKVLFCVSTYYPDKNGIQNVTQYQAEGLAKLGHDVTVITSNHINHKEKNEIYNNVKIIRIDAFTSKMIDYGNKNEYKELLLNQSKINDIIICVGPETWATNWAILFQKYINCKKVLMLHGMYEFDLSNTRLGLYPIGKKILRNIKWGIFYKKNIKNIRKFDAFIHLHEKDYSYKYYTKKKMYNNYILYNAVDDHFLEDNINKENIIINVGTYSKNKNQLECLKVFYKSNLSNYKLILIGKPKNKYYESLLKCKLEFDKKYGFRNVEIYLDIDREETIKLIKKSKIYLLTSFSEKFPISLLEGMASKCAFVSTNVGIVKYLPGGIIGNNTNELVKALNSLNDSKIIKQYAEKGYEFVIENSKIDIQVQKLESIIKETLHKKEKKEEKK